MANITKIKRLTEEIKGNFWSIENLKYPHKNLQDFYKRNNNLWVENAIKLRNDFPKETNIFLANIYKSNFTFKFILEKVAIVNQKRFSTHEKVRFLTDVFENSYHYFGFLTICSNYNKKYIKSLFKEWYIPDLSREYIKRKIDKPWLNKNNDRISGKKWIMLNCPLLKFYSDNIDILQLIKNADSHKKLAITKTEVIILGGKKPIHFKSKEINDLFNYVKYSVSLALHFNMLLAIKYNFWITPALIITNPNKFNLKLPQAPKFPEEMDIKKKSKKKKSEPEKSISRMEYFAALGYNLLNFIFKEIWEDILNDEAVINKFLHLYNLKFNKTKFQEFHQTAIFESLKLLVSSIDDIKNNILQEKFNEPSFIITPETLNEFDFIAFIDDARNTILRAMNKDSDTKMKLFTYLLVPGAIALFSPLAKLSESFDQIIIEEKCN